LLAAQAVVGAGVLVGHDAEVGRLDEAGYFARGHEAAEANAIRQALPGHQCLEGGSQIALSEDGEADARQMM